MSVDPFMGARALSRDSTLGACTRAALDRALRKTLFPRDGSPCAAALCLPGEGTFPIAPILKALDADRFDGAVSLEWERKWHPELEPLEQAMEAFKKLAAPFTE